MKTTNKIQKQFIQDLYGSSVTGSYISAHNLSSKQLMQIYQNNFFSTHIDSLKISYSKTLEILGQEAFEQTARDYIRAHPPQKESIQNYGHNFSTFLKKYKVTKSFLYLPDLARLELLLNLSYYAENTEPLNALQFAQEHTKDPLLGKLRLHPSCYLMQSPYPLDKIMQLTQKGSLKILENQQFYGLIVRKHFCPQLLPIKKETFAFLTEIYNNKDILCATKKAVQVSNNFNLQKELLFFLEQKVFMLKNTLTKEKK